MKTYNTPKNQRDINLVTARCLIEKIDLFKEYKESKLSTLKDSASSKKHLKRLKDIAFLLAASGIILNSFSACAVPLLTGVKNIKTAGGTEISFITGADFRLGANGIDTVDERRGISSVERSGPKRISKFDE